MPSGLNRATLIGNLGADPDVRHTANGGAVCEIRVATTEEWKNRTTGNREEHTEWHRITFFGKLAEIVGEYASKGRQVFVEGRIRTEKYEKDGIERYSTKIIGDEFKLLGPPPGDRGESTAPRSAPPSRGTSQRSEPARTQSRGQPAPAGANDFHDDDIPF